MSCTDAAGSELMCGVCRRYGTPECTCHRLTGMLLRVAVHAAQQDGNVCDLVSALCRIILIQH